MSCILIYYENGAKMTRPIYSPQEYLGLRNGGRQSDLVSQARAGDAEAKRRLVQFNYSCIPGEDGKLKGCKVASTTVGMDIDFHRDDPDYEKKMEGVPALVLSKQEELGLLMLERSATKGYHLVFSRRQFPGCDTPLKSQEANLKWASSLLGVQYDEGAKDITRVFFTTTGSKDDLLFLDDELFKYEAQTLSGAMHHLPHNGEESIMGTGSERIEPSEVTSGIQTENTPLPMGEGQGGRAVGGRAVGSVGTLPYEKIIPALCALLCDTYPNVPEGVRNNTLFEVAVKLRYVCDFNEAKMKELLYPKYSFGLPEHEVDGTIRSALMRERGMMPKMLRDILAKVNAEESLMGDEESELGLVSNHPYPSLASSIIDESVMPRLPKWLETLLVPVPVGYRFVSLVCLAPALMTLLTGVRKKFGTKKEGRLNGWSHLDGPPASGKGMLDSIILPALRVLQAQDDKNQERINEAILQRDLDQNKENLKAIPELPIRILPPDTTRKAHIRMMMRAKDQHTYTYSPELGSMNTHGTGYYNRRDFERLLFDNSFVGSQTAVDDSPNLRTRCNWNLTTASTRDQTLAHWRNVTDGAVTRVFYCLMPDNTFLAMPTYRQHTEEQLAYIDRASTLMMKMEGLVLTPRLDKALGDWLETIRLECEASKDRVRADLRKRTADIAHTFGVVIHLAFVVQAILDREDELNAALNARLSTLNALKLDVSATCDQIAEAERAVISAREALEEWKRSALDLGQYREAKPATEMGIYSADYCLDTQYMLWGKKIHDQLQAAYMGCVLSSSKKSDGTLQTLPKEFTVSDIATLMPAKSKQAIRKMVERFVVGHLIVRTGTRDGMAVYTKCG